MFPELLTHFIYVMPTFSLEFLRFSFTDGVTGVGEMVQMVFQRTQVQVPQHLYGYSQLSVTAVPGESSSLLCSSRTLNSDTGQTYTQVCRKSK